MWFESIQEELSDIQSQGLYRSWRRIEEVKGARIRVEGRWLIHMSSNSYLGLHQHPQVIAAAKEALEKFGTGSGSARLIGGTLNLHEELEAALAAFKQSEAALLFPTGYMANLGVITSLVGPEDLILGDRLNHASIIDACRLSGAAFRVYPHCDVERLKEALGSRSGRYRRTLIVTEGLFSMDGDIAPLSEIDEIARRHDALLLVDDAHATGVLGEDGRGSVAHAGLSSRGILQMGTLSKALGSLGGYLAGPHPVVELLKNKARSFIYTTALPPASVAAARAALRILKETPALREKLWSNVKYWSTGLQELGLDLVSAESPIIPVQVGQNEETLALSEALFEAGLYAPGIRPPTVPAGSARIRTSVTALHTDGDLDAALAAFKTVMKHSHIP